MKAVLLSIKVVIININGHNRTLTLHAQAKMNKKL